MKNIYLLIVIMVSFLISGCNYLDIVPDERPEEKSAYQNPESAKGYLYSCYGYMQNPRTPASVDKYSAGEMINPFEKNSWQQFPRGFYSPSNLELTSDYYNAIWKGIRQCYQFLNVVDLTPGILEVDLRNFKGEATFLIAYYHFLALRAYGPTPIIREVLDPSSEISKMPERSSYDEVVKFIDEKIEEALPNMSESFSGDDYGRFTKYAAIALRSRLYLYAASPLFNGNTMYQDFKSLLDQRHLISQEYSKSKWEKAESVTLNAITQLEAGGYRLYGSADAGTPDNNRPAPIDPAQRAVRYTFMDNAGGENPELIMMDTRKEGAYEIQNQSVPLQKGASGYKNSWSSTAITLQSVEMFYTENGLPIDEDKTYDYENRYQIVDMPADYDHNHYTCKPAIKGTRRTMKLNLNREPRFFAWVSFHGGNYELAKYNGAVTSNDPKQAAIVLALRAADPNGKPAGAIADYNITGYLNKKFVHPRFQNGPIHYPYPLIRMAELYLNYAETLIAQNKNLDVAKEYIDKVRLRAGLPRIDEAWKNAKHPEKAQTAAGLMEILRRERQIEFFLENQRFWDLRRWMTPEILGEKVLGMNVDGVTDEDFFQVITLPNVRTFSKSQYLLPIPQGEINKHPVWVQNPFYGTGE